MITLVLLHQFGFFISKEKNVAAEIQCSIGGELSCEVHHTLMELFHTHVLAWLDWKGFAFPFQQGYLFEGVSVSDALVLRVAIVSSGLIEAVTLKSSCKTVDYHV